MKDASNRASSLLSVFPKVKDIAERLESDYIDLKDLANEADNMQDSVMFDPERQSWIQERLDLIYRLQQKHHVQSDIELIAYRDEIGKRLESMDNSDEEIENLRKALDFQFHKLSDVSHLLS